MKREENKYLSKEIINLFYSLTGEIDFKSISSINELKDRFPEFEKLYQEMNGFLFEGKNNLNKIEINSHSHFVNYLKGAYQYVKEYNIQSFEEYDIFSENLRTDDWKKLEQRRIKQLEEQKQQYLQTQQFSSLNRSMYSKNIFKKNKID